MRITLLLLVALLAGCAAPGQDADEEPAGRTSTVTLLDDDITLRPGGVESRDISVPEGATRADLTFSSTGAFAGLSWAFAGCQGETGATQVGQNNAVVASCDTPQPGDTALELRPSQGAGGGTVHVKLVVTFVG